MSQSGPMILILSHGWPQWLCHALQNVCMHIHVASPNSTAIFVFWWLSHTRQNLCMHIHVAALNSTCNICIAKYFAGLPCSHNIELVLVCPVNFITHTHQCGRTPGWTGKSKCVLQEEIGLDSIHNSGINASILFSAIQPTSALLLAVHCLVAA